MEPRYRLAGRLSGSSRRRFAKRRLRRDLVARLISGHSGQSVDVRKIRLQPQRRLEIGPRMLEIIQVKKGRTRQQIRVGILCLFR